MPQRKRVWIGGAGIGVELVCVAAVALSAPAFVWIFALLVGSFLIAYAILVGEAVGSPVVESSVVVDGGEGGGDVRGNVFGDNAVVTVSPPTEQEARNKRLVRVTPAELTKIYRDHTEVQADKLAEPFLGAWLKISGEVFNVTQGRWSVGYGVTINIGEADLAFASFIDSEQEHLPRLRRGEAIEVVGRLSSFDASNLTLNDCELLDVDVDDD